MDIKKPKSFNSYKSEVAINEKMKQGGVISPGVYVNSELLNLYCSPGMFIYGLDEGEDETPQQPISESQQKYLTFLDQVCGENDLPTISGMPELTKYMHLLGL